MTPSLQLTVHDRTLKKSDKISTLINFDFIAFSTSMVTTGHSHEIAR